MGVAPDNKGMECVLTRVGGNVTLLANISEYLSSNY
jgi:hypothetical protein